MQGERVLGGCSRQGSAGEEAGKCGAKCDVHESSPKNGKTLSGLGTAVEGTLLRPTGSRIAQLHRAPGLRHPHRAGAADQHAAVILAIGRVEGDADIFVGLAARAGEGRPQRRPLGIEQFDEIGREVGGVAAAAIAADDDQLPPLGGMLQEVGLAGILLLEVAGRRHKQTRWRSYFVLVTGGRGVNGGTMTLLIVAGRIAPSLGALRVLGRVATASSSAASHQGFECLGCPKIGPSCPAVVVRIMSRTGGNKLTLITAKNVRRMRAKLEGSTVPISLGTPKSQQEYVSLSNQLNEAVASNNYMPSNGHGYLGYPKKDGCTRFVPILTTIDTIIYYSIVWALEDDLIQPMDGVFGAWHTKPEKIVLGNNVGVGDIDEYSSNTFNKLAWFNEWKSYSDLLGDVLTDSSFGNYVLTTDIANFYDTIDIGKLCDEIRNKVESSHEVVSLLRLFLQYWDRRVKGYSPSSKGIPQELISDASRTLANFYLQKFDARFKIICAQRGVTYVRWADDIMLIGKSRKSLEYTLHEASRALLSIGLNFNASKTNHYTRSEYYRYRGLEVLSLIKAGSVMKLEKAVKSFELGFKKSGGRIDSVFRACISKLHANAKYRTPYMLNFVLDKKNDYYLVGTLDEKQMFRFCALNPSPKDGLVGLGNLITRYPYASAKATLLESMRKHRLQYNGVGVSDKVMKAVGDKIKEASGDSEIVMDICLPSFLATIA